jgi:predicted porin
MQKKLLTLAVAGALAAPAIAVAQSGTEVYGTVNMAFGQFKYTDGSGSQNGNATTVGASVSKFDVANGASNYGVRSRENLGGGLAAWVQIEQNAPLERSSNQAIKPASRNSAVGLQGGWGNFFMGQWTTPWADLDALWGIGTVGFWGPVTSIIGRRETTGTAPNPNCVNAEGATPGAQTLGAGTQVCDALEGGGGVGHAFWRRASNAVFYQSPVMAGIQGKVAYQTNEGKATAAAVNADPSLWSFSLQWAGLGGRARIGAAYDKHKDFTTIGQSDNGYSLKGGWNFGVVDIGAAYEAMTYKATLGDVKAKQYGLALAVPVGPGSIRASYSKAKDLEGAGIAITDTGATQYNVGYEHRFSKRTNVGIGYAKITNKTNAQFTWTGAPPNQAGGSAAIPANTPLFGSDVSTFFISMTHRF